MPQANDLNGCHSVAPKFSCYRFMRPLLRALLTGQCPGHVLTLQDAVLVHSRSGQAFLTGAQGEEQHRAFITYLKQRDAISLCAEEDWAWRGLFEEQGFSYVPRLQLKGPLTPRWRRDRLLPAPYVVARLNEATFHLCQWAPFLLSLYGSKAQALASSVGFCLSYFGRVISEAHAMIAGDIAEIGVVTAPPFRGANLGTTASSFAVDYCLSRGILPFWTCDEANKASAAIAKKLGFTDDCRHCYVKWAGEGGVS